MNEDINIIYDRLIAAEAKIKLLESVVVNRDADNQQHDKDIAILQRQMFGIAK